MNGGHEQQINMSDGQSLAMLTVAQAEDVLQVSRWKIYKLINGKQLDSIKIGRSRRIPVIAVQAYVAKLAEETV